MTYETILIEQRGRVLLVTLNRQKALNAINLQLTAELIEAVSKADADPGIGCIVITGSEKAFAAGADIKEMQDQSYGEMYGSDWFGQWERFTAVRKPIIAAVAGYALGGGCELAMMCDFILAADTARFGQPQIKLGVMPGIGGSQRLTRFVGKAKAMGMCLTGRMMDVDEAERSAAKVAVACHATKRVSQTFGRAMAPFCERDGQTSVLPDFFIGVGIRLNMRAHYVKFQYVRNRDQI